MGKAVKHAFPALQPYGRLALPIQSRSFNSVVAFFIASKSLQLMDPLGEISPVPLYSVTLDNTSASWRFVAAIFRGGARYQAASCGCGEYWDEHKCFWLGHTCRQDFLEVAFLAINGTVGFASQTIP